MGVIFRIKTNKGCFILLYRRLNNEVIRLDEFSLRKIMWLHENGHLNHLKKNDISPYLWIWE